MKHRSVFTFQATTVAVTSRHTVKAVSHLATPFGCGQSVPARPKMR
jgi:hypothetical protein